MFSIFSGYAQKCIKISDYNNVGVAFATLVNSDNSYGTYTDGKGEICIDINLMSDTIFISSVGYKRLMVFKKEFLVKKEFILEETVQELKEVIVRPTKIRRDSFSNFNKSTIFTYKHIWNPNSNILVTGFIENTAERDFTIEKVKFLFSSEKSSIVGKFKVRFRFYENKNSKPDKELIETNVVTELKPEEKSLEYDVSGYGIQFPENGIWIGMEVVGYYNLENIYIPLENGKAGKATYKNNGKIKKINLISPSYDLVKIKDNKNCFTKDFLDKWRKGIAYSDPGIYYSPKIAIGVIEN
jgi:hypothetical protein